MPPGGSVMLLALIATGLVLVGLFASLSWLASRRSRENANSTAGLRRLHIPYAPSRIRLIPAEGLEWTSAERVTELVLGLRSRGFTEVGQFRFESNARHQLWAFLCPDVGLTAVLNEFRPAGVGIELATHFKDGTSFAVVDSAVPEWSDPPPGWTLIHTAREPVERLIEWALCERPAKPLDPDHPGDFVIRFEERYARIRDWRNARGGYTEQEIRALCRLRNIDATDEMVKACRERIARQALAGLGESLLDRFLEKANPSEEEWGRMEGRIVIIHDQLPARFVEDSYKVLFTELGSDRVEDVLAVEATPRRSFRILAAELDLPRFRKAGTLTEPVAADVYVGESDPVLEA